MGLAHSGNCSCRNQISALPGAPRLSGQHCTCSCLKGWVQRTGQDTQVRAGDDRCVKQEWKGECTDIAVDPLGEHQLGCLQPALGCHVPAPGTM